MASPTPIGPRSCARTHDANAVLQGLARAGWRLAWTDTPSEVYLQAEIDAGGSDLSWSIGAIVTAKGVLRSVRWEASAFRAGLVPGEQVVAVNGLPFSVDVLEAAIRGSASVPVVLDVARSSGTQQVTLDYRGPLRYPRLVRIEGMPDRLGALLAPRPER